LAGLIVPSEEFKKRKKVEQAKVDQKKTDTNANPRAKEYDLVDTNATLTPEQADSLNLSAYLSQVNSYSPEQIRALYTTLKSAGYYNGAILNEYSYDLQDAIIRAEKEIAALKPVKGVIDRETYYAQQAAAGGKGQGGTQTYATISDETQAASLIKSVIKSSLGREATPEEIASLTKVLNKAEKAKPSKTVNGITTGGIDRIEFLTQQVEKLPEFAQKKQEKTGLVSNSIQSIARANGLNISDDQLSEWTKAIESGTDPETIKARIRTIAGYGMPDNVKQMLTDGTDLATIYDPYKRTMASVLEINPEDITLNDSVLRSAIGPDKEMPLYEFQRALKKDPRWQYTNNAREEVSNAGLKVLKDFGFQG